MMGTNYSSMMGLNGSTATFFGWLAYILLVVLIILGIAALWKYLQK